MGEQPVVPAGQRVCAVTWMNVRYCRKNRDRFQPSPDRRSWMESIPAAAIAALKKLEQARAGEEGANHECTAF